MTTIKIYHDTVWESTKYLFCTNCYNLYFRPNDVVSEGDAALDATCEICGQTNHVGAPPLPSKS